jgi:hypothetical protein
MVLLALAEWGNRHFAPEGRQMQLVEMATQRVEPVMVDKATGEEIIRVNTPWCRAPPPRR